VIVAYLIIVTTRIAACRDLQPPSARPHRFGRSACALLMRHVPMQFLTRIAIRYGASRAYLGPGFLTWFPAPI